MGADSFYVKGSGAAWIHFTGVVEDVADPKENGRVRVRCFGFHSQSRIDIPTSALPWASVMMPVNSASVSGIGTSPTGVLPGSWVFGFFRDGLSAQDPVVLGTLPSETAGTDPASGFSDPNGVNPRRPGGSDTSSAARSEYKTSPAWRAKKDREVSGVPTAVPPELKTVSIPEPSTYYTRVVWSSPEVASYTQPRYPKNQVFESESGHFQEWDDTPGFRRHSILHPSGTHRTVIDSGTVINTIVGANYTIIAKDDNILVKGSCNLTIHGNARTLVTGNYHLEVDGNYTENVKGSRQSKVGKSDQREIGQDFGINIGGSVQSRVGGSLTSVVTGDVSHTTNGSLAVLTTGNSTDTANGTRSLVSAGGTRLVSSGPVDVSCSSSMKVSVASGLSFGSPGGLSITDTIEPSSPSSSALVLNMANSISITTADLNISVAGAADIVSSGPLLLQSTGGAAMLKGLPGGTLNDISV